MLPRAVVAVMAFAPGRAVMPAGPVVPVVLVAPRGTEMLARRTPLAELVIAPRGTEAPGGALVTAVVIVEFAGAGPAV